MLAGLCVPAAQMCLGIVDAVKGFLNARPFKLLEARQGSGVLCLSFAASGHGIVVVSEGALQASWSTRELNASWIARVFDLAGDKMKHLATGSCVPAILRCP